MPNQEYDLTLFAGLLTDKSHVTCAEFARRVNDNPLEGILEKYRSQLPDRMCRANKKQTLQINAMTNPAGSKNTEPMVMINPDTQGDILLEQLQWNQTSIQSWRNPPFD